MSITNDYIQLILNHPKNYFDSYQETIEKMSHSTAIYKGKPIPFLFQPMFFNDEDLIRFNEIVRILMSITNKVVKKYKEDQSFRKKFGYNKVLEELILCDQGYDVNVPIGRFDIFYGGEQFKFCELNTDGSSAMNEDNTLAKIMLESQTLKDFKKEYDLFYFELFDSWVDEAMQIYDQFPNKNENPTVAIMDFIESSTIYEFEAFKEAFIKKGYDAIICDPRDLVYKNGKLYSKDKEINLIYRRLVTRELIDRIDEIQDFIKAYKDQAVCVIGSLKSQIMHHKIIFKILHDEDTLAFLNNEEQEFIKNHIPLTKEFNKVLYKEVLDHKDQYILKPKDSYGSHGVYAGLDYTIEEWTKLLDGSLKEDYLVQEYCIPYTREFVVYENEKVKVESFKHIVGLFVYNEKLKGLYTRIGKENIISGLHSYYTVCNLYAHKK